MTKEQEQAIEYWKSQLELYSNDGRQYKTLNEVLNLIQQLQEENKQKSEIISECRNRLGEKQLTINKLETLVGLALKGRPLEISKKTLVELDNMVEIECTENILNNSYIFRAK